MRVLHVHSGNLYGGVETMMVTMAREGYRRQSLQAEFALCFEGRLADELRGAGATVHRLGSARTRNPLSVMAARRRLREVIGTRPFGAVVTHMPWAQALFGTVARHNGIPLVFWMHDAANGRHWLECWASLTPPDRVLCNSHYTASTLKRLYTNVMAPIVTYPVTIEPIHLAQAERAAIRRELSTAGDAVVIIQASRMEAWKGHELHLQALRKLRDLPGWACWFAGGAQRPAERRYQERLAWMAAESGISDRVRFLGHRSDIPRMLRAADIYCQPNKGPEPFGIVFIEALAAGIPVVATALGGVKEIVNEHCGVLVAPGDSDALAVALRNLINRPEERRRLGQAGPARAAELCDPAVQLRLIENAIAGAASDLAGGELMAGREAM